MWANRFFFENILKILLFFHHSEKFHLILIKMQHYKLDIKFQVIIPPLPEGGGGYTVLPLSVCPSFRPSKIFFVAFFSVTVNGRNLIFDHKHHIGIPTDPSKCINDQTLRSDTEFCRTSLLKLSDQIVRQISDQILPGRSESLHSQIVKL